MSAEAQKSAAEQKSIVPRERLAFIPKDFDDAWRQADVLSKSNILPDALRGKPHDVLATIVTGAELGLSPMQSMREIYIVKGKGFVSSALKVALVKQSDVCEFFQLVSSSATKAVYKTKRRGEEATTLEYTMDQAVAAGLASNDNYKKHPDVMLRSRCSGRLCDIVYPDVVRGVGDRDDVGPETAVTINAAPSTFAPPPPAMEDAQVVPPTPPPRQPTPEQAFQQAKNEQDLKGTPPAAPPKREPKLKIKDVPTPEREPGSDDGDEAPAASGASETQGELNVEPPSDLAIYAEVKALTSREDVTEAELDALSPKAKTVQGPVRKEIADMFIAARARLNKKRTGGK